MRRGQKVTAVLCAALMFFSLAGWKLTVKADEEVHQMPNQVLADNLQTLPSYIVTNFFAKSSPGVAFRSTKEEAISLMGITKEDLDAGAYPMMFVGDLSWTSQEKKDIDAFISQFNGKVISFVNVELWIHHAIGNWNEQVTSLEQKVKIAFGMNSSYYEGGTETKLLDGTKEFAVVGIHNGKVELFSDVDSDLRTVTIETDKFSGFALVYAPAGSLAEYLGTQAGTAPAEPAAPTGGADAGELDDVPKTGDIAWETDRLKAAARCGIPAGALEK